MLTNRRGPTRVVVIDVPLFAALLHPLKTRAVFRRARVMLLDEKAPEEIVGEMMRDPKVRVTNAEIDGRRF